MSGDARYRSWGHRPAVPARAVVPAWCDDAPYLLRDVTAGGSCLPFGRGRSYGDSCLNSEGTLIDTRRLDRFVFFDREAGLLRAEAGVTLAEVLDLVVPAGWFLPVCPGTSAVTLGGAIANDVHGKNQHLDGSFGCYIESLQLVRSSGECLECGPDCNAELFAATIGGLGLTGLITRASLRLLPVSSPQLDVVVHCFRGLSAYAELAAAHAAIYRYTVAWLDCVARGRRFARGVFFAANHANASLPPVAADRRPALSLPVHLPTHTLNRCTVAMFNALYMARHRRLDGRCVIRDYAGFFFPLDRIGNWNRIYGPRGFYQYQFVLPFTERHALEALLGRIVDSGLGSFLAVLKSFGERQSPGMLSFPRPGFCLALDFSKRGNRTRTLLDELDREVRTRGGAVYPAKDRLMQPAAFRQYYPRYEEFMRFVDPAFRSDFWHRVQP